MYNKKKKLLRRRKKKKKNYVYRKKYGWYVNVLNSDTLKTQPPIKNDEKKNQKNWCV